MTSGTAKFGIGIIGTGMVAQIHARALADLADDIEVRGVYSRNAAKCRKFAQEFGLPVVGSVKELCDDPNLSACIVLTPPNARMDIVGKLANAGKHILLEKPIERTSGAAEAIVDICAQAGVTLGMVFQFRFRAASQILKTMVEDGRLGSIYSVQLAVPWWRPQSYYDEPGRGSLERDGGGVLINQAIHGLDLMQFFAGPVAEVQSMAATSGHHTMETEDFVAAALRFTSGAIGSFMATTATYPGGPEVLVLNCEKATARLDSGALIVEWLDGTSEIHGAKTGTGGGADPMAFPHEWHAAVINNFMHAVQSRQSPAISGKDALANHYLIDALLTSSKSGRASRVKQG
ncbi:MAG: Gfo/Idh/MocA family oxidoreductase [Alphaproteobacteria bacterium]|nr:Gfo/Idh/MocA family oxidoreductase [Alphaproteobacteria bacterium]